MANIKKPQTRARKRWMAGNCPICNVSFKSDECPHTFTECEDEVQYQDLKERLMKDIRAELGL